MSVQYRDKPPCGRYDKRPGSPSYLSILIQLSTDKYSFLAEFLGDAIQDLEQIRKGRPLAQLVVLTAAAQGLSPTCGPLLPPPLAPHIPFPVTAAILSIKIKNQSR